MAEKTKIYVTFPYDNNGIKEIEADSYGEDFYEYSDACSRCTVMNIGTDVLHLTREAAVDAATKHRANHIAEVAKKLTELLALPPISP